MAYFPLAKTDGEVYNKVTFPGSSMVEQEAVNFEVTGSSPVRGARIKGMSVGHYFLFIAVVCYNYR